jgi:NitT/TauT family transport system substrate-binding protein
MSGNRRSARGAGVLLALAALASLALGGACSPGGSAGGASPVRLGLFPNVTHATALVGLSRGYFSRALGARYSLQTSTFNAGPAEIEALNSGALDLAYVGPGPAVSDYVQSHGQALRIVAGATSGGAALVVKPSIRAAGDLRGQKLATPQLGNTQDIALRHWLSQNGLRTDVSGGGDVEITPEANSTTVEAFASGAIAGAWVPEPYVSRLVMAGGSILVDERDLWPERRFATTVLVTRTDFLIAHVDAVRRLLEGQIAANRYIADSPAAAAMDINAEIAALTGKALPSGLVSQALTRLSVTNDPLASTIQAEAHDAHALGLLPSTRISGLFDLRLLNSLLPAGEQVQAAP